MKKSLSFILVCLLLLSLAPITASADSEVIVSFGDSITASGVWQRELNAKYGLNIINMGVGGDNSADGRKRLPQLFAKSPDTVIIFFGANDSALDMAKGRPMSVYLDNMRYMITECQKRGIKVIAVLQSYFEATPYYTRHNESVFAEVGGIEAYMDSYIEAYRALATELGVYIADVRSLCNAYSKRSAIIADGVHPNTAGYHLYAQAVGEVLVEIYSGDVNGDGKINAFDYISVKRHALNIASISETRRYFADMNGDGEIGAADYLLMKRKILLGNGGAK